VIVVKNKYYYTAYNASAIILSNVMGYKLGQYDGRMYSGGPNIEKIEYELQNHDYSYIVVEYGKIVVQYNGKKSFDTVKENLRERETILFKNKAKNNTRKVGAGETISLFNIESEEVETYELYEPKETVKYLSAGGAYYGARTKVVSVSEFGVDENGTIRISINSPLGKELLEKSVGEEFVFKRPDGNNVRYRVISIEG